MKNAEQKRRDSLHERPQSPGQELARMERQSDEKADEILQSQFEESLAEEDAPADKGGTRVHAGPKKDATLTAGDIMSARIATVVFDDTIMLIKGIFSKVRFHHLPVVDEAGRLIGIISDRDFLRSVSPFLGTVNEQTRDIELMKKKVGLIMTRNPTSVTVDAGIVEAIKLMNDRKVSCLPVVDAQTKELLGIVTWKDIVRALCPEAFPYSRERNRLKTGVTLRPRPTESGRFFAEDE